MAKHNIDLDAYITLLADIEAKAERMRCSLPQDSTERKKLLSTRFAATKQKGKAEMAKAGGA